MSESPASTHRTLAAGFLLLSGAAMAPQSSLAAESYDACAGYIDSLPAVITTQGTWCLRGDLATAITSGDAISIQANNVTVDCNHFKLGGLAAGPASTAYGIQASARLNATVRNCNVRGFIVGISLSGGGALVEGNRLDGNLYFGIYTSGDGNLVSNNRVFDTGGQSTLEDAKGIRAEGDVIGNLVDGVVGTGANTYPTGIHVSGDGALARDNVVRNLVVEGAGEAIGILSYGIGTRLDNNHLTVTTATSGSGIYTFGGLSACTRNTINNFGTGINGCDGQLDNLVQDTVP